MNYHFIKLFSLKDCSESIISHFNNFLKSKDTRNLTIEHGAYQSLEGRNKNYNYLLKISVTEDPTQLKAIIENEYLELLKHLKITLNDKNIFSIVYESSVQLINQSVKYKSPMNHLVFLPFKETCKHEEIEESFELLTNLFKELPGIASFSYGKCPESAKNYVFEMNFADEENRDSYLIDPKHIEVAQRIIPLLEKGEESIIAFDYPLAIPAEKLSTLTNSSFFTPKNEKDKMEGKPNEPNAKLVLN